MKNYPKTFCMATLGGLAVLIFLITLPFFAIPIFAAWIIMLFLAHRQDVLNMCEDDEDEEYSSSYEERESNRDRFAQFLGSFNKTAQTDTKTSASPINPRGTLTPEQEKTLELLAADLKEETDKDFDLPIPLTWDTFNPFRWRKHK